MVIPLDLGKDYKQILKDTKSKIITITDTNL